MVSQTYRKVICSTLSSNFRQATEIVQCSIPKPQEGQVLIKSHYLGLNASDINFTNGKYLPGVEPPFDCGFEAVGEVVEVGEGVEDYKVGDAVSCTGFGCFAEYRIATPKTLAHIPFISKSILPLTVCGLTASIALTEVGNMKSNETVFVSAAAGGTGQFAVQLAKLAGNHVIGTCSSSNKVEYLKSIGCDRVINYKEENINEVLTNEYPNGLDLVFESVGGDVFDTCVNHLAVHGRLIVIGFISGYEDGSGFMTKASKEAPLPLKLLKNSTSIRGFFLQNFTKYVPEHIMKLSGMIKEKKLIPGVDPTEFKGLEGIADGLDHMYARKNIGKVVVSLKDDSRL